MPRCQVDNADCDSCYIFGDGTHDDSHEGWNGAGSPPPSGRGAKLVESTVVPFTVGALTPVARRRGSGPLAVSGRDSEWPSSGRPCTSSSRGYQFFALTNKLTEPLTNSDGPVAYCTVSEVLPTTAKSAGVAARYDR